MLAAIRSAVAAGDATAAVQVCEDQLRASPADPEAHRHLSQLQAARGEFDLAQRSARRACALAPQDPRARNDLGRVLVQSGKLAAACACFGHAVQLDVRYADGWHNLGTALKKLGERKEAFTALKNSLLLDPKRADTYLNLGNLLIDADQFEDAVQCFERAAVHDPKLFQARNRLAQELSAHGKVRRAESLFRQSLGLNPDQCEAWFGLGRTLEDLGESDGALACYLKVLKRRPTHAMALGQYLALVRDDAAPEMLQIAQAAMVAGRSAQAESGADVLRVDDAESVGSAALDPTHNTIALIGYGLAKYHDRRGDYAKAAAAGQAANAARRRKAGSLDRAALAARIDGIIGNYTAEFFTQHRRHGLGTDQPVFIVGLPRSGTTLTEQILSAHPLLHGAGELADLSLIAGRAITQGDEPWQAALRLGEMQSRVCAQQYLKSLRDGAPSDVSCISDKSPLNFFQLAFAALMFPGARVIHCQRELRDNALSIWIENFAPDQRYATDFDDLAFFIAQYQRLMAHWREHLPLKILDLQYEDTVHDLEGQARKLIQFLDVPWDARCLDFHQSERAVQTPSRWQVRQPIYSKSVARWRIYEPYLPQLDAAFAAL